MMSINASQLKAGDVLLYNSDGWLSWLICKFDDAEVSHAGLYLGDGYVAEALAVGDRGVHRHDLAASFGSSNWVDVRRLSEEQPAQAILEVAERYAWQGNRYAYGQILMLAAICLTRKIDRADWMAMRIAEKTLHGAASILRRWRRENREPMICSEFVFRTYDEAVPDVNDDPYTLSILSQGGQQPRRRFSMRRRRLFGAAPEVTSPTAHPDSLLAELEESPDRLSCTAGPPEVEPTEEEIRAEIEELARQYSDEAPAMTADGPYGTSAAPADAEAGAAAEDFARELVEATRPPLAVSDGGRYGAEAEDDESDVERLKRVVADFVTPGDLHRSPSLQTVGRLTAGGLTE